MDLWDLIGLIFFLLCYTAVTIHQAREDVDEFQIIREFYEAQAE